MHQKQNTKKKEVLRLPYTVLTQKIIQMRDLKV